MIFCVCAGFGQPGGHLGADPGVADGLGLLEGGDICLPPHRRYGIPGSSHAQETQQACQRSQGKGIVTNHVTIM